MNSTGRTVGEQLSRSHPENLVTTSRPTIVTRRDNSVQPEGLRTISQPSPAVDKINRLATNASNSNVQTRGKGNAAVYASPNSTVSEECVSVMKNNSKKSIACQDVVAAVHVVSSKVLHEKQCTSEAAFCAGETAAAESACCPSPARPGMEALGLCCRDDDAGAASSPSARPFSDSENENPAQSRRDEFSRHSLDSIPTPRAPMKPSRVKSLNTLFPGNTRRRLDFDHL